MLAERSAIRVSDAEREAAASALGDHLVSGRLDVAEYEERVGRAWSARYAGELAELFVDLSTAQVHAPMRRRGPRPFVLAPVMFALAVIGAVVVAVNVIPWVFLLIVGMFLFHGARRRRYRYHYAHYPRRMRTISV